MADLSKLRSRRLGSPPAPDEALGNLAQPETAPAAPEPPAAPPEPSRALTVADRAARLGHRRIYDGRSARATGRLIQLATRVSPEFDNELREYAQRHGMLLVEVLEAGLKLLLEREKRKGSSV